MWTQTATRLRVLNRYVFFKAPVKVGRRFGLDLDIIQLGCFYVRLSFLVKPLWTLPCCCLVIYMIVIGFSCSFHHFRSLPLLNDICTDSILSRQIELPRHFDLWAPQADHNNYSNVGPPVYIERIMIGHLVLRDSALALRHQISKTKSNAPSQMTDGMFDSLGKENRVFF